MDILTLYKLNEIHRQKKMAMSMDFTKKKLVLTCHPYLSAIKEHKTGKGEKRCGKKHWGPDIQYFLMLSGILSGS